jgi:hypothetical protein
MRVPITYLWPPWAPCGTCLLRKPSLAVPRVGCSDQVRRRSTSRSPTGGANVTIWYTVLSVGRHSVASDRRKSPVVLAAVIAPAAVFFAVGADVPPFAPERDTNPVVRDVARVDDTVAPCCLEIVPAAPVALSSATSDEQSSMSSIPAQFVSASRWRVAAAVPRLLPAGVAPERGLQVRTILAARSISAAFPEIHEIGGVRPDPLPWHPNGLALDVTIPNHGTAAGIALVLKNATRFGMQDAIWRGTYYTPDGPQSGGAGHYDHVHITTTGGGYPTGGETYVR